MDVIEIEKRVAQLRQSIPPTVRLIAVSKQIPVQAMRAAYAAGIRDFGENRIQEAIAKQSELLDLPDLTWHFIGHLQRNKAKQAITHFQWIHSVDSLELAQRLNQIAESVGRSPEICLQVKIRPDPSKFGWTPAQLQQHLPDLKQLTTLHLRGLMAILPLGLSEIEELNAFQDLTALANALRQHPQYPLPVTELSMGMSDDYLRAIQAGATMVRLGRVLFGERMPTAEK
jgi:pyridoxal phosphate enzyme (YggS family)